jgi:succinate-semialdehyde dehydrogenase / glutarate-semialdehyde dehydrogenase
LQYYYLFQSPYMSNITTINPNNMQSIAEYQTLTSSEINQKLEIAAKAYKSWRKVSLEEKKVCFVKLANVMESKAAYFAAIITEEMGKVPTEAMGEILKCVSHIRYYVDNIEKLLAPEIYDTPFRSMSVYAPTGAILGIMPWNYPFWQVLRYALPTIFLGNVTLLKHAPNVLGCATAIEQLFLEAGFPEGVIQHLILDIQDVEQVIASDVVQGVSLTGSEKAGSAVAALSGKYIKKSVMELGGSDPFIILDDAEMDITIKTAVTSRMMNAGQACICAKRFIVTPKIADAFIEKYSEALSQINQGAPTEAGITMGPLARIDLSLNLQNILEKSIKGGAKLILGGEVSDCHFKPTLIDHVDSHNEAFLKETFGPLAAVIRAKDEEDAIRLANDHHYGLGASIWTADRAKGEKIANQIDAGMVYVNSMVRSDSKIPFGGTKRSGYGREHGKVGMMEFANIKTVVVE